MRNLKKLLAVIVAVCTILAFTVPAFAADAPAAPADSKICSDLGVLKGDTADGVTAAYLAKGTTRLQAAILQLRLLGKEAEAYAETSTENFADADTVTWADGKALLAYLKKNPDLGWIGTDGKFDPTGVCTAQMLYKVLLESIGYKTGTDFQYADAIKFAGTKGLTKLAALTNLTNNDVASALVEALKATVAGGTTTLAQKLIDNNIITEAAAEAANLVVAPKALDLSSAVAINSKVVEVTLATAATAKDLTMAQLTAKDSAGKAVAVSGAAFAPWGTDGTDVLVTLGTDTTAGTLYTITAGSKSVNFGGVSADTTAPTVSSVKSIDYNKIEVTFSEAVKNNNLTVTSAEKYGSSPATLTLTNPTYNGKNAIDYTTSDQKGSTLYGADIKGAVDYAGNAMTEDTAQTYVGTAKDANVEVLANAKAMDYQTVEVQFNENVDPATITAGAFSVKEMYGSNPATINVTGARVATTSDTDLAGGALVSAPNDPKYAGKFVILTVASTMKDATLYKVTATGVKTMYGVAMSSTDADLWKTFVGTAIYSGVFEFGTPPAAASSNTMVTVNFARKVDAATAQNVANYAIVEAYGSAPATLAVSKAVLESNGTAVDLTVAPMGVKLYKLTVTGVKDIAGNALDTAANTTNFAGQAVNAAIGSVSVSRAALDSTHITLTFDQAPDATALTDISHYSIDGGVGYPTIAAAVSGQPKKVLLTIPATTNNKVYTVTVNNLKNTDGVQMASALSVTFLGYGVAATLPEMQAVVALDSQTIEVYFDRTVTDSSIDGAGKVWTDSNHQVVAGALGLIDSTHAAGAMLDIGGLAGEYAYQDPANTNGLIIRLPIANASEFVSTNIAAGLGALKVVGSAAIDASYNALLVAPNANAPTKVSVDAVMALNSTTLRIYFNQPVTFGTPAAPDFAKVDAAQGTAYAAAALSLKNATAVDSTNKVFDFSLSGPMIANSAYWLIANPTVAASDIADTTGMITLNDEDTTAANLQQFRQFAGTTTAAADINSISVLMTDAKTMVVYYPALMANGAFGATGTGATAKVTDADNYSLVNSAGAAVKMDGTAAASDLAAHIVNIAYDTTANTATITLNQAITSPAGGAFLKFGTSLKNATLTQKVEADSTPTAVVKQFATSAAQALQLAVSSASIAVDAGKPADHKVTIVLNQTLAPASKVTLTAANVLTYFKVTVNNGAAATVDGAVVIGFSKTNVTDDTITFDISDAITAGQVGAAGVQATQPATAINGYNGEGVNTSSASQPFAQ